MSEKFYRAFEDKHRGSRELIRSRLHVYLPFITPLKDVYPDAEMVDLGCGRGEWLELLDENGFSGQGIDIDNGMLTACHELGLSAEKGDALSYLKALPDESKVVISGFHIAEHLLFEDLQLLVAESLRVLKPAGLLILETPNPENIVVGTSGFYLDPTHQRPIPPELLAFLPEYYGFEKVKILRLQDSPEQTNVSKLSLLIVLNGVSPDYAVISQKSASSEMEGFSIDAFDVEYGVTLEHLATVFGQRIEGIEEKAQQAGERAQQAEEKAQQAGERAQQAEEKAQQAGERAQQAEEKAWKVASVLHELLSSRSWRITQPLRDLKDSMSTGRMQSVEMQANFAIPFNKFIKSKSKNILVVLKNIKWVKKPAAALLSINPHLKHKLWLALSEDRMQQSYSVLTQEHDDEPVANESLPSSARNIYSMLRTSTTCNK